MQNPIQNRFSLKNKIALVTGAGGHLGKVMSRGLCEAGASVVLAGRNLDTLEALAKELKKEGFTVLVTAMDVTEKDQVEVALEQINSTFGCLDIIVNNAYSGTTSDIESTTVEQFQNAFHISVSAAFQLVQLSLPLLKKSKAHLLALERL